MREGNNGSQYGLNASVVRAANEFLIVGSDQIFENKGNGAQLALNWLDKVSGTGNDVESVGLTTEYAEQLSKNLTESLDAVNKGTASVGASKEQTIQRYRHNVQNLNTQFALEDQVVESNGEKITHKKKILFRAYTAQGVNLDITTNTASGSQGISLPFGSVLNTLFNVAPVLDTTRRASYAGPSPISYNVDVHLFLRTNFEEDIVHPLMLLLALSLPFRISSNISTKLDKLASSLIDYGMSIPVIGDMLAAAEKYLAIDPMVREKPITTFIGDAFVVSPPAPYSMFKQNTTGELTALIGGFRFTNVVISKIAIKIPTLLVDGGYPDRLAISIGLQSLRLPTFDYVKDMFVGLGGKKASQETVWGKPYPPAETTKNLDKAQAGADAVSGASVPVTTGGE